MVYTDTNIGSRGILRCEVTVESQDVQANTSTVRVKGQVRLSSGGPSGDQTGNCKVSITGERSWGPVSYSFVNLYTSWFTFADQVYTIPHNQDGTKSVTFSVNFGPTITQNLGSGGTSTVSGFALPQIARAPAAPSLGAPIFVDAGETEVILEGVRYLRIEGAFYCGIGCLFLLYGLYRALGRPGMSVVLTVVSLGTRVALAYLLSAIPAIGVIGIWWSVPIGWALADLTGLFYYKARKKELLA